MTANGECAQSLGDDANVLMLIQVPLKYRAAAHVGSDDADGRATTWRTPRRRRRTSPPPARRRRSAGRRERADVDTAVLGHGPTEGPYTELDGLTIERDARFPVRVTLQFYQATSNGVVVAGEHEGDGRADQEGLRQGRLRRLARRADRRRSPAPDELDRRRAPRRRVISWPTSRASSSASVLLARDVARACAIAAAVISSVGTP